MCEARIKTLQNNPSRPMLGSLPKFLKLNEAILYILRVAQQRIHIIADRLRRGLLDPKIAVQTIKIPGPARLPENEEWHFALGDFVRIKVSMDDFKWIQKETLEWRVTMYNLHGQVGTVLQVQSKYQNAIAVHFPEDEAACEIYAELLEKVAAPEYPGLRERWKPGDIVKTLPCKEIFVDMMTHFNPLERGVIGKPGRIVSVDYHFVFVTYDEITAFAHKSYWLLPCHDSIPIKRNNQLHVSGFKIGEKVRVTSNMKKLMENQKKSCRWKEDASSLLGATVTVVGFFKRMVIVQAKHSRRHTISKESLSRLDQAEEKIKDELDFVFGDIVSLVLPKTFLSDVMAMASIPNEFLRYLKTPAVVSLVNEDFQYLVQFSKNLDVYAHSQIISKPIKSDLRLFAKIKQLTEKLSVGDRVHLDVGPPSFVRTVIKDLKYSPKVKMALTESAVLEGYLDPYYVIIKYNDGTRFRIRKEYLTVPEKFFIKEEKKVRKPNTSRRNVSQQKRRAKK